LGFERRAQKRQGDAPLRNEQPGPHGHPDVALPICNHIPKKGCTGGKIQKKPSLSASLGLAKGYGYASLRWEVQVAKSAGWCQERKQIFLAMPK